MCNKLTPADIYNRIEYATKIVNTWPKWKQNILENSNKAQFDVPRKPVNNSCECCRDRY